MRVVVLGSGVVGVTSGFFLARAGHEVTVIDREPGPTLEASFGNAGQISPGYAAPWAATGVPLKAVKWRWHCVWGSTALDRSAPSSGMKTRPAKRPRLAIRIFPSFYRR